jgi:uncharacterized protein (DUF1778 family)
MYPDPKRIKDNRITIRLDAYEHDLIQALANYQGEQVATLLRRMALREAQNCLTNDNSVSQATA